MKNFVESVLGGEWTSASGEKFTDVINIGIGGSHLGPAMVTNALSKFNQGLRVHYVSNIDSDDIYSVLQKVDLQRTLFVIASKTFTTLETMKNANTAKSYFLKHYSDEKNRNNNNINYIDNKSNKDKERNSSDSEKISKHFIALSTNIEECEKFGIPQQNMFEFWDWVGGRYSLWSAIGLSTALSIGWENFEELLRGAYELDRHFRSAPFEKNIPILYGLITFWYSTFWNFRTNAIIPYSHQLSMLSEFLQQLEMESNGKYINQENEKVDYKTGQIIWGEAGTNSQHSFFQLIHQGTDKIPVDFIGFSQPSYFGFEDDEEIANRDEHHRWLLSNMLAQAEALMKGKTENEVREEFLQKGIDKKVFENLVNHKIFEGNRPSNIFLIKELTPRALGKLIAIFEHKVFVQGILWKINSFDQWGVELGKQLAQKVYDEFLNTENKNTQSESTQKLINIIKSK